MKSFKPIWNVIGVLLIAAMLAMALPLENFAFQSQALAQDAKTWYVDDDLADYPVLKRR